MSKFAKFALLTLAAFFVLGFSITATAAKPDKNHTLTSAPLFGDGVYCVVANTTEEAIDVHWDIYFADGSKVVNAEYTVEAHTISGTGGAYVAAYCVVSWYGQKDDVRGTFCSEKSTSIGPPPDPVVLVRLSDVCLTMD